METCTSKFANKQGLCKFIAVVAAGILFYASVCIAKAETGTAKATNVTVFTADIVACVNPEGLMLIAGGLHRGDIMTDPEYAVPASYKQLGFAAGVSPAYFRVSFYAEWKPTIFAQVRLLYNYYGYHGENGGLLSFPSAKSKFGKEEIDFLEGQEEAASGHRILLQPVLTGKIGPVIIRNTTDFGYYVFDVRGPYFYEFEYDTLLKEYDVLLNNQTAFLIEAWKGKDYGTLMTGPFYEITHTFDAALYRQRTGVQFYWLPFKTAWRFNQPRFYGQVGFNIQDRNRDNEAFLETGVGADF